MARTWNSYNDIDEALELLKTIHDETGTIPDVLINSYKASLEKTKPGLVQRFYKKIVDEYTPLLKYFK